MPQVPKRNFTVRVDLFNYLTWKKSPSKGPSSILSFLMELCISKYRRLSLKMLWSTSIEKVIWNSKQVFALTFLNVTTSVPNTGRKDLLRHLQRHQKTLVKDTTAGQFCFLRAINFTDRHLRRGWILRCRWSPSLLPIPLWKVSLPCGQRRGWSADTTSSAGCAGRPITWIPITKEPHWCVVLSWSLLGTSAEVRGLMAVKQTIRFHDC